MFCFISGSSTRPVRVALRAFGTVLLLSALLPSLAFGDDGGCRPQTVSVHEFIAELERLPAYPYARATVANAYLAAYATGTDAIAICRYGVIHVETRKVLGIPVGKRFVTVPYIDGMLELVGSEPRAVGRERAQVYLERALLEYEGVLVHDQRWVGDFQTWFMYAWALEQARRPAGDVIAALRETVERAWTNDQGLYPPLIARAGDVPSGNEVSFMLSGSGEPDGPSVTERAVAWLVRLLDPTVARSEIEALAGRAVVIEARRIASCWCR